MNRNYNDLPSIKEILIHYGAKIRITYGQVYLRCPFHSDTHQSGSANIDKNIFICFACGVQGNSIHMVHWLEHWLAFQWLVKLSAHWLAHLSEH